MGVFARVFDHLYFLGQPEYSVWAIVASEGIVLVDTANARLANRTRTSWARKGSCGTSPSWTNARRPACNARHGSGGRHPCRHLAVRC